MRLKSLLLGPFGNSEVKYFPDETQFLHCLLEVQFFTGNRTIMNRARSVNSSFMKPGGARLGGRRTATLTPNTITV